MSENTNPQPNSDPQSNGDALDKGLHLVQRRVFFNRFLSILFFDLFITVSAFGFFMIAQKMFSFDLDIVTVLGFVLGASLIVSLTRGYFQARSGAREAAILIDENLNLKERVSTTVYLRENTQSDADGWGKLVERDGLKAIAGVNLSNSFPINLPSLARWILVPLVLCLGLIFLPDYDLMGLKEEREAEAKMKEEIAKEIEKANEPKVLDTLEEEKDDPELKEFAEQLKKEIQKELEEKNEELGNKEESGFKDLSSEDAKKGAMVQLSKMENILKAKMDQKKYDELKEFQKKNDLKGMELNDELARKLQDALKKGDFKKADEALQKLTQELQRLQKKQDKNELTKEEKDKLKKLTQDLQKLAQNAQAMQKQAQKSGDKNQANQAMQQMAQMMQQMSQSMQNGNMNQAMKDMKNMQMSMSELAKLQKQMEYMDKKLQQMKQSKQNLAQLKKCKSCGKAGQCNSQGKCGSCSGNGNKPGQGQGQNQGLLGPKGTGLSTGPKEGIGQGQGKKGTPEATKSKREHLRDKELDPRGTLIATLNVEGEVPKGDAKVKYHNAAKAAQSQAKKVDREAIPVEYRDQVKRYMNSLLDSSKDSSNSKPEGN